MQIKNPRTGEYDYTLNENTADELADLAKHLRKNQMEWNNKGLEYRSQIMTQWAQNIEKYQKEIAEQLSIDTGRIKISKIEVSGIIGMIKAWSFKAPQLMKIANARPSALNSNVFIEQQMVPYSMVGVISPWNFPLLLALIDTIPALYAGSTVLLKPSEVTPRFMDPLEKSIQETPELAGVLKLIRGGKEAGKAVVNTADAICFTGSVNTGKSIAKVCSERFIPAFLELGGKDPGIVLNDADLETTTDAILRSAAGATGHACQSLERIYVDESIFEAFVNMISEKAEAVILTAEDPSQGQMGPIIFEQQALKIQDQINDAVSKGAVIHTGGKVEKIKGGLWCRPTVMTKVDHGMKIMTEETFGPIIPIMSFQNVEEAIKMANDSIYGLSASVFSKDQKNALMVAQKINAGAISINDGSLTNQIFDAEKNSFGQSGLNASRMGDAGFMRFFRKKAMLIQTANPAGMASFEEGKND